MSPDSIEKPCPNDIELENEIADLEHRLAQAKAKRQQLTSHTHPTPSSELLSSLYTSVPTLMATH
jgi:urease accessory protein